MSVSLADAASAKRLDLTSAVTLLGAVAWFWLAKSAYLWTANHRPELVALVALIAIAPAAMAWRESYDGTSPAFTTLLRGIVLILGFYALTAWHFFPPDLAIEAGPMVYGLFAMQVVAVAASVAALWRPVAALVPAFYVLIAKDWTQALMSLPTLTRTDYLPVVELGAFLAIGIATSSLIRILFRHRLAAPTYKTGVTLLLFYAAVAIHFGNYFHSAVEKLVLDGGWLSWTLDNPTHLLLSNTLATKHLPIAHLPAFTQATYEQLKDYVVPMNVTVMAMQLYAVAAVLRRRHLIVTTIVYDVSHILIFVVTGILFWKWILLNLAIVAAARKYSDGDVGIAVKWIGPAFVVFGTLVFFAARLGWYDTPAFNKAYFTATTEDGRTFEVPSNYFAAVSVTVAQMRLGAIGETALPAGTWGATSKSELVARASGCRYSDTLVEPELKMDVAWLRHFVRSHHRSVISRADDRGRIRYDVYPHHVWSNPALFDDFHYLDKRTIATYTYVNEAVCVTLEKGKLREHVYQRHELDIPLDEQGARGLDRRHL